MKYKFRAWNKKYKFMMEPDLLDLVNYRVKYDSDWYEQDEFILEQCIGFDKYNNEVYEGDIFELPDRYLVVQRYDSNQQIGFRVLKLKTNVTSNYMFSGFTINDITELCRLGNIHETVID
jgi:hypothetical protein